MTKEELEEVKKYKDYPEGSGMKRYYDSIFLPFTEYLKKYYSDVPMERWYYWTGKFVSPLFDGTSYDDYEKFLHQAKPSFKPNIEQLNVFWNEKMKGDNRFDKELKELFSFLYSIGFYENLSFEE